MNSAKIFFLVVAFFLAGNFSFAQDKLPPLITVSGEAVINVAPDEVVLNFGVQSVKPSADEAKKDLDMKIQKILSFVKSQGIDPKNFQTSYLQLYQNFYGEGMSAKNADYIASETITLTLKNLSSYEKIISGLIGQGVNRIDGIFFQTSEIAKYREQARALAIKSAKEKAEKMAKELGQKIGGAYMVEEDGANPAPYRERNMMVNSTTDVTMAAEAEPTIAAGQIPVRARVRVSFVLM